jgi:tRNA-specific 2-thiouridylase
MRVIFEKTQESITPGQSIVLYDGAVVLGGGIIKEVVHGHQ